MRKGSTLRTNLDCLRFTQSAGIQVVWNLLVDFPNEEEAQYEETPCVAERILNLQAPADMGGLSIDRFSPDHMTSDMFDLMNVHPPSIHKAITPREIWKGSSTTPRRPIHPLF